MAKLFLSLNLTQLKRKWHLLSEVGKYTSNGNVNGFIFICKYSLHQDKVVSLIINLIENFTTVTSSKSTVNIRMVNLHRKVSFSGAIQRFATGAA